MLSLWLLAGSGHQSGTLIAGKGQTVLKMEGVLKKKEAKPIYDVLFFHPTSPQYLKYRSDRKALGQLVCVAERLPLPCLFPAVFLAYVTSKKILPFKNIK